MNNRQGGRSPLHMPFLGLPINDNTIDSPSVYGKLRANSSSGRMTFGIHATSVVAPGTCADVLSDVNGAYLTNTSGVFNGFSWAGHLRGWFLSAEKGRLLGRNFPCPRCVPQALPCLEARFLCSSQIAATVGQLTGGARGV
ncbi:hypothetical protein [Hydrogenophaga sp.]|uniref:hypothetical protein n=1 Tax=Hydrogenophaga sp. TaxID=1904254 RepID=UPI003AF9894C